MRKVKDAVDLTTNEKIYFKGHAKATYLSDGRNVEDAIAEGNKFVELMEQSATPTFTIDAVNYKSNTIVHCGVLSSLTISSISALPLEVNIRFSTGESVDDFLNIPADAKKVGDVTCEASCEYVMSILDGVIILGKIE